MDQQKKRKKMKNNNNPMVTDDDFTPFLRWLVKEHGYSQEGIINVVEKPYRYSEKYNEFIESEY